jgi:hypothetical protein
VRLLGADHAGAGREQDHEAAAIHRVFMRCSRQRDRDATLLQRTVSRLAGRQGGFRMNRPGCAVPACGSRAGCRRGSTSSWCP